jgi:UDP-N-acetylmuramyl pentapeptide phosphotransferase/UDP-N-acetylglucosamine-1-phosphate transferase
MGIAAPFFLFCLLYLLPVFKVPGYPSPGLIPPLLLGGGGCFLLGLWDDLRGMKAWAKLILQILCALVPIMFGLRIHSLARFTGMTPSPLLGYGMALCWILLVINAFNFMDGMNGLAGTFAAVTLLFISALTGIQGKPFMVLCIFIAASCIGFLIYNLTPALTFMGDGGSQFLGYVLAVIPLYLHKSDPVLFPFGAFVILLFPFLYDVLFTLARRIIRDENLFEAHRTHLYQRLMIAGWSHPKALRLLFICFLICGFLSLGFTRTKTTILRGLFAFMALLAMMLYTLFVLILEQAKIKVYGKGNQDDSFRKIQ